MYILAIQSWWLLFDMCRLISRKWKTWTYSRYLILCLKQAPTELLNQRPHKIMSYVVMWKPDRSCFCRLTMQNSLNFTKPSVEALRGTLHRKVDLILHSSSWTPVGAVRGFVWATIAHQVSLNQSKLASSKLQKMWVSLNQKSEIKYPQWKWNQRGLK